MMFLLTLGHQTPPESKSKANFLWTLCSDQVLLMDEVDLKDKVGV